jgi:cellulose synthase/poly-beta-1,6-N-acetylglucosamine synthase-like glycosyltransferase
VLWLPITVLYAVILAFFFAVSLNLLYMVFLAWRRPPRHVTPQPLTDYPYVTVQLPIFNELYVIERLLDAACKLDWPRDRLDIQVLDDSTDETQYLAARLVRRYAERGINVTHLHRTDRVGYKAGALEEGLKSANGEFIAIFDADFIPPVDFLKRTVPYFGYPNVGFVQTRWGHVNQSYSLLTEIQSVTIDAHFMVDQVARNRGGYFMNFNGTAGVWRRETVQDSGGWQHDTVAEDLDLSYRAQLKGWEAVYLPDVVTHAELPVTVSSYRCQQRRWAAGSIACAVKLLPTLLRAKVSLGVKIEGTFHLCGYLTHAFLLLMFLFQPIVLYHSQRFEPIGTPAGVSPVWSVIATIPALAPFVYLAFSQWRANGFIFSRIPYILASSVMGAGIMLTTVTAMVRSLAVRRKFVFERTPKYGIARSGDSWDGKRYTLGADGILGAEVLLACYGMGTLAFAAALRSWASVFFCLYFLCGLFFIIAMSIVQLSVPMLPRVAASVSSGNRES